MLNEPSTTHGELASSGSLGARLSASESRTFSLCRPHQLRKPGRRLDVSGKRQGRCSPPPDEATSRVHRGVDVLGPSACAKSCCGMARVPETHAPLPACRSLFLVPWHRARLHLPATKACSLLAIGCHAKVTHASLCQAACDPITRRRGLRVLALAVPEWSACHPACRCVRSLAGDRDAVADSLATDPLTNPGGISGHVHT